MIEQLERLIAVVDGKLNSLPPYEPTADGWRERNKCLEQIFAELVAEEGAKTSANSGDITAIRLAGIRSSSTCGVTGALTNWKRAAQAKIGKLKGGDE